MLLRRWQGCDSCPGSDEPPSLVAAELCGTVWAQHSPCWAVLWGEPGPCCWEAQGSQGTPGLGGLQHPIGAGWVLLWPQPLCASVWSTRHGDGLRLPRELQCLLGCLQGLTTSIRAMVRVLRLHSTGGALPASVACLVLRCCWCCSVSAVPARFCGEGRWLLRSTETDRPQEGCVPGWLSSRCAGVPLFASVWLGRLEPAEWGSCSCGRGFN